MTSSVSFVNFGTDKDGEWAACTRCGAKYRDWNPEKNVAHCQKCRKEVKR